MTATEAFLRSAHLDHGDPPLPPADDTDVGARYARDAMRATARSRTRSDEERLQQEREAEHSPSRNGGSRSEERPADDRDDPDREDAEGSGKPLGWLFRSSS